ncbi:MAG: flagellar hook protein FlgE [Planctomycetota bacterium]|jgi:flagellar hook protein FlgE
MSFALAAAVTGLQAHQKMLDVAGNNLANINTTGFKASKITFSELLSETIRKASAPSTTIGGVNPQQMGSGVGVAGICRDMAQGNIVNTGQPLDLAMEGEGYFVLNDGQQNVFTRCGAFGVDAASVLIDPATGFRVQRIGSVGESDGFQTAGDSTINVPYDTALPARATSAMTVAGNLSADGTLPAPQTQLIVSNIAYTVGGAAASTATELDQLDQFSGNFGAAETASILITGFQPDGTPINDTFAGIDTNTTLNDLVSYLNTTVLSGATASLLNGKIRITDDTSGYSLTDIRMTYQKTPSGTDSLTMPGYFEIANVGGEEVKTVNITVYDSQGGKHVLSGAFVRTDTANEWDMLLTSVTGNISGITVDGRRIDGITFDATDGSYLGLSGTDTAEFVITFAHDTANPQTISVSLGTEGECDGLTQFAGASTAVVREQDGYESGRLTTVSVNNEGILIGAFSNGIKKDIATLQVALFQNPAGLESVGSGYFISSANSGEAVATQALNAGAGAIHGGTLEKSNADVASEFVNMILAQNGFQANARTIRVANEVLRELSNLIR